MDGTQPHAHALRKGRRSIPGQTYLITAVTQHRQPVFADLQCGRLLVQALKTYEPGAKTLCYVVMPDHFHWLMTLRTQQTLPQIVAGVKRLSARTINQRQLRQGALWQSGFHDHAIRTDDEILRAARYITANPLRAGLVQHLADYPLWDAIWL